MVLLAVLVSWVVGPFVRCPHCGNRGASLRIQRAIGNRRARWRCRSCAHSHIFALSGSHVLCCQPS
jgi:transposase-like protein